MVGRGARCLTVTDGAVAVLRLPSRLSATLAPNRGIANWRLCLFSIAVLQLQHRSAIQARSKSPCNG